VLQANQCTANKLLPLLTLYLLQRELTSKVQRIDTLQAELNATQAEKASAEAAAAEAKDQVAQLQSSLAQVQRQVDILGNHTDSKETQLQQLKAEVDSANNAKTGLELQVRQCFSAAVCTHKLLVNASPGHCCSGGRPMHKIRSRVPVPVGPLALS
jgi:DNA repair exonuclease SbcCD ATPase subunit